MPFASSGRISAPLEGVPGPVTDLLYPIALYLRYERCLVVDGSPSCGSRPVGTPRAAELHARLGRACNCWQGGRMRLSEQVDEREIDRAS